MSTDRINDELVGRAAAELRERFRLDDEELRALGARLAEADPGRQRENREFAEQFTRDHSETFDHLAQ